MAPREWVVKPASSQAEKAWTKALAQEPEIMEAEKTRLRTRPLDRSENPRRTHQLRGSLAERKIQGHRYEQWQHEITSGGRIWYCPDKTNQIIYVTHVSLSHPKET